MTAINISLDNFSIAAGRCIDKGIINAQCVYNDLCAARFDHYQGWLMGLLWAYLALDLFIPLLFTWLGPRLNVIPQDYFILGRFGHPEGRRAFLIWAKERLLWAFAILALFMIYY